jgi:hypothetical protein
MKDVKRSLLPALVIVVLFTSALHGQAPFTLKRFGRAPVSDAEVAQIAELASSAGKRLWLLRTPNTIMMSERVSYLFLEPDVFGKQVLRGRVLRLRADEPPNLPIRSPWTIRESQSYACVPIAGRQLGEIEGEHDLDWPFVMRGEFDDDTLISIVEFIRSEPPIPVPAFLNNVPAEPIGGIARDGDAIVVSLRPREEAMGHAVWLVRKDGRWVITRSETSMV